MMWRNVLYAIWAVASTTAFAAPQGLDVLLSQRQVNPPNQEGIWNGRYFVFWSDGATNATYTNLGANTYSVEWSGGEFYCGQGWKPGISKEILYSTDYSATGNQSFLAIYGRFNNPDAEYYIVENHIPFNPPPSWKTTGTLETGGGVYTLYESWLPPSPRTLWAIRAEKQNSGAVKLTDFFDAWRLVGVNLGNHRQVIVATIGSSSSGQARVYSLTR